MPGFNQVSLARYTHSLIAALQQIQARAPPGTRPVPPLLHDHAATVATSLQRLHEQLALLVVDDPLLASRGDGGIRPDDVLHLVRWWQDGRLTQLLHKLLIWAIRDVATVCVKAPGGPAAATSPSSRASTTAGSPRSKAGRSSMIHSHASSEGAPAAFEQYLATPKAAQCVTSVVVLQGVLQLVIDAVQLLRHRPPGSFQPPPPPPPPPPGATRSYEALVPEQFEGEAVSGSEADARAAVDGQEGELDEEGGAEHEGEEGEEGVSGADADRWPSLAAAYPGFESIVRVDSQGRLSSAGRPESSKVGRLPPIKPPVPSRRAATKAAVAAEPPSGSSRWEQERYQQLRARQRHAERLYVAWSGLQDAVLELLCNTPLLLNLTELLRHASALLGLPGGGGGGGLVRTAAVWRQVWSLMPPVAALAHAVAAAGSGSLVPSVAAAAPLAVAAGGAATTAAASPTAVMDPTSAAVALTVLADSGLLPQCCDVVLSVPRGSVMHPSAVRQSVTAAAQQLLAAAVRLAALAEAGGAFKSTRASQVPAAVAAAEVNSDAAAGGGTEAGGSGSEAGMGMETGETAAAAPAAEAATEDGSSTGESASATAVQQPESERTNEDAAGASSGDGDGVSGTAGEGGDGAAAASAAAGSADTPDEKPAASDDADTGLVPNDESIAAVGDAAERPDSSPGAAQGPSPATPPPLPPPRSPPRTPPRQPTPQPPLPTAASAARSVLDNPAVQYFLCERQASAVVQAYGELAATAPQPQSAAGGGKSASVAAAQAAITLTTTWIVEPALTGLSARPGRGTDGRFPSGGSGGLSLNDVLEVARSCGLDLLPVPALPWRVPVEAVLDAVPDITAAVQQTAGAGAAGASAGGSGGRGGGTAGIDASVGPLGHNLRPEASWTPSSLSNNVAWNSAFGLPGGGGGGGGGGSRGGTSGSAGAVPLGGQLGRRRRKDAAAASGASKLPPLRLPVRQPDSEARRRDAERQARQQEAAEHEGELVALVRATSLTWQGIISGATGGGGGGGYRVVDSGAAGGDSRAASTDGSLFSFAGPGTGGDAVYGGAVRPLTPLGYVPSASRALLQLMSAATVCRVTAAGAAGADDDADGSYGSAAGMYGMRDEDLAALLSVLVGNVAGAHGLCSESERLALHEQQAGLLSAALAAAQALLTRTSNPDVSTPLVAVPEACLAWMAEAERQRRAEQALMERALEEAEATAAAAEHEQLDQQLRRLEAEAGSSASADGANDGGDSGALARAAADAVARAAAVRLTAAARDAARLAAAVAMCEACVRFLVAHHQCMVATLVRAGLLRPGLKLRPEHSRHVGILRQTLALLAHLAGCCAAAITDASTPRAVQSAAAAAAPPYLSPMALAAASHTMTSTAVAATYAPVTATLHSALLSVRKCLAVCAGQLVTAGGAATGLEPVTAVCAVLCAFPGQITARVMAAKALAAAAVTALTAPPQPPTAVTVRSSDEGAGVGGVGDASYGKEDWEAGSSGTGARGQGSRRASEMSVGREASTSSHGSGGGGGSGGGTPYGWAPLETLAEEVSEVDTVMSSTRGSGQGAQQRRSSGAAAGGGRRMSRPSDVSAGGGDASCIEEEGLEEEEGAAAALAAAGVEEEEVAEEGPEEGKEERGAVADEDGAVEELASPAGSGGDGGSGGDEEEAGYEEDEAAFEAEATASDVAASTASATGRTKRPTDASNGGRVRRTTNGSDVSGGAAVPEAPAASAAAEPGPRAGESEAAAAASAAAAIPYISRVISSTALHTTVPGTWRVFTTLFLQLAGIELGSLQPPAPQRAQSNPWFMAPSEPWRGPSPYLPTDSDAASRLDDTASGTGGFFAAVTATPTTLHFQAGCPGYAREIDFNCRVGQTPTDAQPSPQQAPPLAETRSAPLPDGPGGSGDRRPSSSTISSGTPAAPAAPSDVETARATLDASVHEGWSSHAKVYGITEVVATPPTETEPRRNASVLAVEQLAALDRSTSGLWELLHSLLAVHRGGAPWPSEVFALTPDRRAELVSTVKRLRQPLPFEVLRSIRAAAAAAGTSVANESGQDATVSTTADSPAASAAEPSMLLLAVGNPLTAGQPAPVAAVAATVEDGPTGQDDVVVAPAEDEQSLLDLVPEWREAVLLLEQVFDLSDAWEDLQATDGNPPEGMLSGRTLPGYLQATPSPWPPAEGGDGGGDGSPRPSAALLLKSFLRGNGSDGGGVLYRSSSLYGVRGGGGSGSSGDGATAPLILTAAEATRAMLDMKSHARRGGTAALAAAAVVPSGCSYSGCVNLAGASEMVQGRALICKCERVSYCSTTCQMLDWMDGHQLSCRTSRRNLMQPLPAAAQSAAAAAAGAGAARGSRGLSRLTGTAGGGGSGSRAASYSYGIVGAVGAALAVEGVDGGMAVVGRGTAGRGEFGSAGGNGGIGQHMGGGLGGRRSLVASRR